MVDRAREIRMVTSRIVLGKEEKTLEKLKLMRPILVTWTERQTSPTRRTVRMVLTRSLHVCSLAQLNWRLYRWSGVAVPIFDTMKEMNDCNLSSRKCTWFTRMISKEYVVLPKHNYSVFIKIWFRLLLVSRFQLSLAFWGEIWQKLLQRRESWVSKWLF